MQAAFQINLDWKPRLLLPCVGSFSHDTSSTYKIFAKQLTDGTLSFATIALALKVPRMVDAKKQQIAVFIWGGIIFAMYSFLLSVFRVKNGGYPFHLPPF